MRKGEGKVGRWVQGSSFPCPRPVVWSGLCPTALPAAPSLDGADWAAAQHGHEGTGSSCAWPPAIRGGSTRSLAGLRSSLEPRGRDGPTRQPVPDEQCLVVKRRPQCGLMSEALESTQSWGGQNRENGFVPVMPPSQFPALWRG